MVTLGFNDKRFGHRSRSGSGPYAYSTVKRRIAIEGLTLTCSGPKFLEVCQHFAFALYAISTAALLCNLEPDYRLVPGSDLDKYLDLDNNTCILPTIAPLLPLLMPIN
jgi:hypothetical protein